MIRNYFTVSRNIVLSSFVFLIPERNSFTSGIFFYALRLMSAM